MAQPHPDAQDASCVTCRSYVAALHLAGREADRDRRAIAATTVDGRGRERPLPGDADIARTLGAACREPLRS